MPDRLPPEVPPAAEGLLAGAWGRPVHLRGWEPLNAGKVYRCCCEPAGSQIPTSGPQAAGPQQAAGPHPAADPPHRPGPQPPAASVIVKIARREQSGVAYDPDAPGPNPARRFFGEWAALEFLSTWPGLAPRFYGGDRVAGVVVLEDHGPGPRLTEVLMNGGEQAAREALVAYAAALARVHAATSGREADYARLRRRLGPEALQGDAQAWRGLCEDLLPELRAGLAAVGVEAAPGFEDEYAEALAAVRAPGPFAALTQCDACPDNCRVEGGVPLLLDFERAGYHHALIDAACAPLCFPSCGHALRIPDEVIAAMSAAYRAGFAPACPAAADDARFGREMARVCAYWLMSNGNWLLGEAVAGDATWGFATWRQRVVTRLDLFARLAAPHLPAMGLTAERCVDRARRLWPESVAGLSVYPAFRPATGACDRASDRPPGASRRSGRSRIV